MGRVSWSDRAEADLQGIDPAVADQLRRNAEETLHYVYVWDHAAHEGTDGEIMWHRGCTHEQERQIDEESPEEEDADGLQVWDYFLFYRQQDSEVTGYVRTPEEAKDAMDLPLAHGRFEVLAVRSTIQMASMWKQMTRWIEITSKAPDS